MKEITGTVGRALGGVSLVLGSPLVAAPETSADVIGADGAWRTTLLQAVGARELAVGVALLARPRPWLLWARVAGDAMDLGLLGWSLSRAPRLRTAVATAVVVAITQADLVAAVATATEGRAVELTAATTVNRTAEETYQAWRDLEQLPSFMIHLDEVRSTGPRTSHWTATAPFGRRVEWDAEIVEDQPGSRLSWRSTEGATVSNAGEVRFVAAPGDRGTEVHVRMRYVLPAGVVGRAAARWFGEDPHQQLDDDLRRFKQILETGEVVRSDGAPGGKHARHEFPQRPARPLTPDERQEAIRS